MWIFLPEYTADVSEHDDLFGDVFHVIPVIPRMVSFVALFLDPALSKGISPMLSFTFSAPYLRKHQINQCTFISKYAYTKN